MIYVTCGLRWIAERSVDSFACSVIKRSESEKNVVSSQHRTTNVDDYSIFNWPYRLDQFLIALNIIIIRFRYPRTGLQQSVLSLQLRYSSYSAHPCSNNRGAGWDRRWKRWSEARLLTRLLPRLSNTLPLIDICYKRMLNFVQRCLTSESPSSSDSPRPGRFYHRS